MVVFMHTDSPIYIMSNRLLHVIVIILSYCHYEACGWTYYGQKSHNSALLRMKNGANNNNNNDATFEVVGACGRMGSLFLRQPNAVAVSRGLSPGCSSPLDNPIYVTTPSKSWKQIYNETLPSRRNDLVWIGNGLLLDEFVNATVVVPHYGVLHVGNKPTTSLSSLSPPTYIYGKHARHVQSILQREGIQTTHLVKHYKDIQVHAAQKLLWASCMWLLCHSYDPPITLQQVHTEKQQDLTTLVKELLPVLENIMLGQTTTTNNLVDTLGYMQAYSQSMPDAIPSKELAITEIEERNGVWLEFRKSFPQPFHEYLLQNVAGYNNVLAKATTTNEKSTCDRRSVHLKYTDLAVWGTTRKSSHSCRSNVVVIGSGILGTSVALNLFRRGVTNVTVLDALDETKLGTTTPASWAWLNANNKSPPAYQWLNQLGMYAWHQDDVLSDLANWNGALVQYEQVPNAILGGYPVQGPLDQERIEELEPQSNFSYSNGPVYFFPAEGSVDPAAAVRVLRQAAKNVGVRFLSDQNVTALVRTKEGRITGVQSYSTCGDTAFVTTTRADTVVVAAGIGSASRALGGLPLTHSPGQIAFARTKSSSAPPLKRILVDTVRQSHVLQRQDGTIVVGGGFLEVGGTPAQGRGQATDRRGNELLNAASQLAPEPLECSEFSHSAKAVRPMPKDGLPAVGYLEPGLYTVRLECRLLTMQCGVCLFQSHLRSPYSCYR